MTLTDLLALLQGQHWLAAIALLTLVLRKWTSAASSFPVTIPQRWRGTVTAVGGLVYGLVAARQAGASWAAATLSMAIAAGAGGFLDGLLVAIFDHDAAPSWARAIVFIFDDLTTSSSPPVTPTAPVTPTPEIPPPPPPPTPPQATRGLAITAAWTGLAALALLVAMALTGCANWKPPAVPGGPVPADVEADIACVVQGLIEGKGFPQLEASCLPGQEQSLVDILNQLVRSSKFAEERPEAAHNAGLVLQTATQMGFRPTMSKEQP